MPLIMRTLGICIAAPAARGFGRHGSPRLMPSITLAQSMGDEKYGRRSHVQVSTCAQIHTQTYMQIGVQNPWGSRCNGFWRALPQG